MTGKACGQPKTSVPWSKITADPADFIAKQYLPREIMFNEPTRMEGNDLTTLLEWWQDCEANNPGDVLKFKKYIMSDGSVHPVRNHPAGNSSKQVGKHCVDDGKLCCVIRTK